MDRKDGTTATRWVAPEAGLAVGTTFQALRFPEDTGLDGFEDSEHARAGRPRFAWHEAPPDVSAKSRNVRKPLADS